MDYYDKIAEPVEIEQISFSKVGHEKFLAKAFSRGSMRRNSSPTFTSIVKKPAAAVDRFRTVSASELKSRPSGTVRNFLKSPLRIALKGSFKSKPKKRSHSHILEPPKRHILPAERPVAPPVFYAKPLSSETSAVPSCATNNSVAESQNNKRKPTSFVIQTVERRLDQAPNNSSAAAAECHNGQAEASVHDEGEKGAGHVSPRTTSAKGPGSQDAETAATQTANDVQNAGNKLGEDPEGHAMTTNENAGGVAEASTNNVDSVGK